VLIATGRSELGTAPVARELGLELPCVVFNGAGLWCPRSGKLLEERLLSNRTVGRVLDHAAERQWLTVVMQNGVKLASPPEGPVEGQALQWLDGLRIVPRAQLPREFAIRITVYSRDHGDSARLAQEVEGVIAGPVYLTHFPLAWLATHRESPFDVVDVQPPCRGKGEALRWLAEERQIDPRRVVAVGDATNDLPMFERAGLAVAMGTSMPEARAAAHRVIGDCNTDALADLVAELFPE
jgi:HAD superfamily hydrolase (TIGR01484 family)